MKSFWSILARFYCWIILDTCILFGWVPVFFQNEARNIYIVKENVTLCHIWKIRLLLRLWFLVKISFHLSLCLNINFLVGKFLYSTFINALCKSTQVSNIFNNETVSKVHTNFNSTVIQAHISESCFVQFNFKDYFLMSALHYHKTYSANLSSFNTMIMNVWKILLELIQFFLSM